jgi:hypothetical protein
MIRLRRLLVTAKVVPISLILVTLIMEALRSSETSVLTRTTRHNIPEDGTLHHSTCFRLPASIGRGCGRIVRRHVVVSRLVHIQFIRLFNVLRNSDCVSCAYARKDMYVASAHRTCGPWTRGTIRSIGFTACVVLQCSFL